MVEIQQATKTNVKNVIRVGVFFLSTGLIAAVVFFGSRMTANKGSFSQSPSIACATAVPTAQEGTPAQTLAALTNDLNQARRRSSPKTASGKQALTRAAQERKNRFVTSLSTNPFESEAAVLPQAEWEAWNAFSVNCAEQRTTLTGIVTKTADIDNIDDQIAYQTATLTSGTQTYHLTNLNRVPLRNGATVILQDAVAIDGEVLVTSDATVSDASPELAVPTTAPSTANVLAILGYYRNQTQPTSPTPAEVRERLVGTSGPSVAGYYLENSYGHLTISGAVHPSWIQINLDATDPGDPSFCNVGEAVSMALTQLDSQYDYSQFSNIVYVSPFGSGCNWSGYAFEITFATSDAPSGQVTLAVAAVRITNADQYAISHEIGHSFGRGHAGFAYCTPQGVGENPGCRVSTYGDFYDVMGGSSDMTRPRHYSAIHKEQAGWLTADHFITISDTVPCPNNTCAIEPMETVSSAPKVLKMRRTATTWLYVEYRQPIGYDVGMSGGGSDVFQGVILHAVGWQIGVDSVLFDPTPPSSPYTMALRVGETFTDPATDSTIRLDSITTGETGHANLEITLVKTDFDPPTVAVTEPTGGTHVNGQMNFEATASDPSGISKVEFYAMERYTDSLFLYWLVGTDTEAPYAITLDSRYAENGQLKLQARAYDDSIGNPNDAYSPEVTVTIENSDTEQPVILDASSWVIGQTVTIWAHASDNVGVHFATVSLDNDPTVVASAVNHSWTAPLNPAGFLLYLNNAPPGQHNVTFIAYDFAGNVASSVVSYFLPDTTPPTVAITAPANGATVGGTVAIQGTASDQGGISRTELYVDDALVTTGTTAVFNLPWNSPSVTDGNHVIRVRALDFGTPPNSANASVTVAVDNTVPTTPANLRRSSAITLAPSTEPIAHLSANGVVVSEVTLARVDVTPDDGGGGSIRRFTLAWGASTDSSSGIAGYRLYSCIGTVCTPSIRQDVGNITTFEITNATIGITLSFEVTAVDNAGNESARSNRLTVAISQ